jgi:hypothetical protein
MRKCAILMVALQAAAPLATKAAAVAVDASQAVTLDLTSDRLERDFGQSKNVDAPILPGSPSHYIARASGLDRIDPADMRVLGGQIGGNGVQGGAVVSLTWPTER